MESSIWKGHFHTILVLIAFLAVLIAYLAVVVTDKSANVLEDLLLLLGGGVAGTAASTALRR